MMWLIVGALAACLTTFAFVPQIIKILKTKSVEDVSLITILQFAVGVFLWMAYGVHLKDAIIICANGISFASAVFLFFLYCRYKQKT
jgi:MtN3 and saliva related transmembrane protein